MKVYLDCDGVIADFVGSACKHYSVPRSDLPKGKWNIVEDICKIKGFSQSNFWDGLGFQFWSGILPTTECFDLYNDLVSIFGVDNINICTSPTDAASLKGKFMWLKNHFPEVMKRKNYYFCYHKEALANSNALLIDDKIKNCELFFNNGGKVIPWPNEHNLYNDCETVHCKLSYLRNQIKAQGLVL